MRYLVGAQVIGVSFHLDKALNAQLVKRRVQLSADELLVVESKLLAVQLSRTPLKTGAVPKGCKLP